MDKVIFGDNQFFGVNHKSESKAAAQLNAFQSTDSIYKSLEYVNEIGIKSFMFTTHDRFDPIFERMAKDNNFKDFKLIPCMPYAHKYANAMVDMGIFKAMGKFIPGSKIVAASKVTMSAFTANPVPLMKLLIDSEMKQLKNNNVDAIFLQNIVVDLLLGLGGEFLLAEFSQYVEHKYNIRAGFITMNYVKLANALVDHLGLDKPLICSGINKIGFRMNPSQQAVEECLALNKTDNIAMSILASGAIKPEEAVNYIAKLPNVKSVLFGASSPKNIKHTNELLLGSL
ncbi:MAG: hypothetical protein JKY08_11620 [Flavobacteriaceae bacterium]|nr:hypothetical protein [Flavobacteriaceae bacterium]